VDEYLLDHAIMALVDVENGARRKARRNESSDDPNYPSTDPAFTLIRSDVLIIKPTPTADGQIQVWAVVKPQQMSADTDSPDEEAFGAIPPEWHDAIVTYALWKAGDYADDGSSQMGERYRILYEGPDGRGGRLAQIRIAVNKRGTAKGPNRPVRGMRYAYTHDHWVG
jgi:hypothetical protein